MCVIKSLGEKIMINQCTSKYTVFKKNDTNEYVALRECSLAFGNKGIEIYYVDNIHFAAKFPLGLKYLKPDNYHKVSADVLKVELSLIKPIDIEIEYIYKKVEQ